MSNLVPLFGASGASGRSFVGASDSPAGSRPEAPQAPRKTQRGHPTLYAQHRPMTLTPEQRFAFSEMAPAALWIGGNLDGAKPRDWGDNEGAWPVRLGIMQTWEDRVTAVWDRDPSHARGLICRLWFYDYDEADRIWCRVFERLRAQFTDARRDWMLFGRDATLGDITAQVLEVAAEQKVVARTDDELIAEMNRLIAMAKKIKPRG